MDYRKLAIVAAIGAGIAVLAEINERAYIDRKLILSSDMPTGHMRDYFMQKSEGVLKTPGRTLADMLYSEETQRLHTN